VTVNNTQVLPGNPGDPTKSQKINPRKSRTFTKSEEITNFLGGPGKPWEDLGGPGGTWEDLGGLGRT